MAKKITIDLKEHRRQNIEREILDAGRQVDAGYIPKNPTRLFKAGDSVIVGALKNAVVTEVLFDGLAYLVHYDYMGQSYGRPNRKVGDLVVPWVDVFDAKRPVDTTVYHAAEDIRINYYNNDISSLLHKVYNAGVDFNPDYQRDLVWTMDQKLALLDSIFNRVEIGKFTFIVHSFEAEHKYYYEILDGKQRLSTICEFYEDRIVWNGRRFSELSNQDCQFFTSFPVIQAEVGQLTEQQIYKLFIKMNTSGTPVDKKHLDKIRSLIV